MLDGVLQEVLEHLDQAWPIHMDQPSLSVSRREDLDVQARGQWRAQAECLGVGMRWGIGHKFERWWLAVFQECLHQCGQTVHFRTEHADISLILIPGCKTRLKGVKC